MKPTIAELTEFERIFCSDDPRRDAFRARLFGLFSEDLVRTWCANERAAYADLGRPTVWSGTKFSTLDFTLRSRTDGGLFASELKAEMAFENYKYLRLTDPTQLDHHALQAFRWLLDLAVDPASHRVQCARKPIAVSGAILVWGTVDAIGRAAVMGRYGFADVLSLEQMLSDLRTWNDPVWKAKVADLHAWSDGLFDGLD
jgi:hypothetical protein